MTDKNHKAAPPRTVCDICAREFCDSQTSVEDLAECYRLGFERRSARLAAAEELLGEVRPTLDDINGLLGGEGDPGGEMVARSAGLLRDRIDATLSRETGASAAQPPDEAQEMK